jgi:hypothetical protein
MDDKSGSVFRHLDLEDRILANHSLPKIRQAVNDPLASTDTEFATLYMQCVGRAVWLVTARNHHTHRYFPLDGMSRCSLGRPMACRERRKEEARVVAAVAQLDDWDKDHLLTATRP